MSKEHGTWSRWRIYSKHNRGNSGPNDVSNAFIGVSAVPLHARTKMASASGLTGSSRPRRVWQAFWVIIIVTRSVVVGFSVVSVTTQGLIRRRSTVLEAYTTKPSAVTPPSFDSHDYESNNVGNNYDLLQAKLVSHSHEPHNNLETNNNLEAKTMEMSISNGVHETKIQSPNENDYSRNANGFISNENDNSTKKSLQAGTNISISKVNRPQISPKANKIVPVFPEAEVEDIEFLGLRIPPALTRLSSKRLWKRRHARTVEEGIRRGHITDDFDLTNSMRASKQLRSLLKSKNKESNNNRKVARTITGLIVALVEEAQGLQVQVNAQKDTPLWGKQVDTIRINFERLGTKQLRIGGLDSALTDTVNSFPRPTRQSLLSKLKTTTSRFSTPEEAFRSIDIDNSATLDPAELATAISCALDDQVTREKTERMQAGLPVFNDIPKVSKELIDTLANKLVSLYDKNGDKALDPEEYRTMVEDMAVLRKAKRRRMLLENKKKRRWNFLPQFRTQWRKGGKTQHQQNKNSTENSNFKNNPQSGNKPSISNSRQNDQKLFENSITNSQPAPTNITDVTNDNLFRTAPREGSIVLQDLKLDLRRLLFGGIPYIKRITPGGPLILEPFTMTVTGSFNAHDILNSFLLDAGLRLLVARALVRRVRSLRDFLDGAVFYGRTWNTNTQQAPQVEIDKLSNIEFDKQDRVIISGTAKVRASPDAPLIEQSFKVRTRIGTAKGSDGRVIRLKDPEIALVVTCPKPWERNIVAACKNLNLPIPKRPKPLYTYIPLVSPLKKTDTDGFNLGEDNCIKSIDIQDGALRFEMSAVLRPGRFLGNHYLAFTVPNRTFILTLDRVREGIRVARRNKKIAKQRAKDEAQSDREDDQDPFEFAAPEEEDDMSNDASLQGIPLEEDDTSQRRQGGVFGRFVEGYVQSSMEESNARLTSAISEWFGVQDDGDDDTPEDDTILQEMAEEKKDTNNVA